MKTDARDLPGWPNIHKTAAFLVAEVIAEGSPSDRSRHPQGTTGCFGCMLPLALLSAYGWISTATGPAVATGAGIINYFCCSAAFYIGRVRAFQAIMRRVTSSVLALRFSADLAVSAMLASAFRSNPDDPSTVGLSVERRAEALRASHDIFPDAMILAGRAIAGKAPLGHPVSLARWSTPTPSLGFWIVSLLLLLAGVFAWVTDTLAPSTVGVALAVGGSLLFCFEFGRHCEFRDACDRLSALGGVAPL